MARPFIRVALPAFRTGAVLSHPSARCRRIGWPSGVWRRRGNHGILNGSPSPSGITLQPRSLDEPGTNQPRRYRVRRQRLVRPYTRSGPGRRTLPARLFPSALRGGRDRAGPHDRPGRPRKDRRSWTTCGPGGSMPRILRLGGAHQHDDGGTSLMPTRKTSPARRLPVPVSLAKAGDAALAQAPPGGVGLSGCSSVIDHRVALRP